MKKLFVVAAFAAVLSIPASFGSGRIELRPYPVYDQPTARQRDYQWQVSQQAQERRRQDLERQRRDQWQRDQWQMEQQRRNHRHERWQSYELWLGMHHRDYDNRR